MRHVESFNLVALLGLLSATALIVCVFVLTGHMDREAARRERTLLSTTVAADMQASAASLEMWTRSDEAVRHLDHARDTQWARTTFPTASHGVGIYTFDYMDRLLSTPNSTAINTRQRRTEPGLAARVALLRPRFGNPAIPEVRTIVSYFWQEGTLYLMLVSPFTPASSGVRMQHAAPPVLVAVTTYKNFLDANLAGMGLNDVKVTATAPPNNAVVVKDSNGRLVGWIGWEKTRPGADLRRIILWPMIALTAAFVALLIFAHRRALSSQRKLIESEARATHLALHDQLTELANRRCLVESLDHAIKEAAQNNSQLALLLIDLDQFKQVNDTYGHQYGDEIIKETAVRLKSLCRDTLDLCARLGGDEFVILARGCSAANAERLAARVLEVLSRPVMLPAATIQPAGSVGVAIFHALSNPESLLQDADRALYSAKDGGRNTFRLAARDVSAITNARKTAHPLAA